MGERKEVMATRRIRFREPKDVNRWEREMGPSYSVCAAEKEELGIIRGRSFSCFLPPLFQLEIVFHPNFPRGGMKSEFFALQFANN